MYSTLSVFAGLQLKTKDKPLKSFTYALTPHDQTDVINPVKKKPLVTDNVQGDHVIAHKLEPGQKLAELVAQYRRCKYTKAVVVVNIAKSLMLEPAYLEGLESSNFPVLIVSQNDGQELLGILDREDEDVLCDIDVESAVDGPAHSHLQRHQQLQVVTEQPRAGAASLNSKSSGIYMYKHIITDEVSHAVLRQEHYV